MVRPNLHRLEAKNDPVFANRTLGQRTAKGEEVLKSPHRLTVIAVGQVNGLASQPIAICRHAIVLVEAEISAGI